MIHGMKHGMHPFRWWFLCFVIWNKSYTELSSATGLSEWLTCRSAKAKTSFPKTKALSLQFLIWIVAVIWTNTFTLFFFVCLFVCLFFVVVVLTLYVNNFVFLSFFFLFFFPWAPLYLAAAQRWVSGNCFSLLLLSKQKPPPSAVPTCSCLFLPL